MTEPAPTPTPPPPSAAAPPLNTAIPTPPAPATPATPPWGADENFDASKAWELIQNLRKEKAPTPADTTALQQQVAALEASTAARNKALAEALGLAEPPKSEDALAETVKNLQSQFEASQLEATKLRLAANPGVDTEGKPLPAIPVEYHNLLTETDTEKLKAQAEMVARLVSANVAATATPPFVPNPGQGQGGTPATPEAQAAAEYAQYYPSKSN
jgi:hypothetical protein